MLAPSKQAVCSPVSSIVRPAPTRRAKRAQRQLPARHLESLGGRSDQATHRPAAAGEGMAAAPAEAPPAAAGAEERELSFVNPTGERLVGKLLDTGSQDVVILCHG